jgi:hypothetical protein
MLVVDQDKDATTDLVLRPTTLLTNTTITADTKVRAEPADTSQEITTTVGTTAR